MSGARGGVGPPGPAGRRRGAARGPSRFRLLAPLLLALTGSCTVVGAPAPEAPPPLPPPWDAPPTPGGEPGESTGRIPAPVPRPFAERRALWVVRTTLAHPDSVRAMVERADRAGFNTLVVQVRGRGDAYYRSRVEPRAEPLARLPAEYDPLALLLSEAHARGLQVHAWVNTHLIASATLPARDPGHLLRERPDLLAVPRSLARALHEVDPRDPRYVESLIEYARANADRVEGLYSSPHHPDVKEHLYSVWMDLAERYPVDGIHFDYVRYPSPDFDYSRSALDAFRAWAAPGVPDARRRQLDGAYRSDPLAWVEALPGPWDDFRREQITELVESIHAGVKAKRPELIVSAAVFADADDAYRSRFQDWRSWLRRGIVDAVAPMAYTPDDEVFRRLIRTAIEAAGGGERVWAGIGVYRNTYAGTMSKIAIARELGSAGVVLFSYDWAAHEAEPVGGMSFLDRVGEAAWGGGDGRR